MRLVAVGVALVGLAAMMVVQLDGTAELVAWEVLLLVSVVALGWGRWPPSPEPAGSLVAFEHVPPARRVKSLSTIESEIAGAIDETLGSAAQVRKRLSSLICRRVGVERLDDAAGRRLLGDEAWSVLTATRDTMDLSEVELVVARLEQM